jgi:hypothetical protein
VACLGDVTNGTIGEPPAGIHPRGIIDIYGDSVVAILPTRYRERLHAVMRNAEAENRVQNMGSASEPRDSDRQVEAGSSTASAGTTTPTAIILAQMATPSEPQADGPAAAKPPTETSGGGGPQKTIRISFTPDRKNPAPDPGPARDKAVPTILSSSP